MFGRRKSLLGLDIGSSEIKAIELTEFGNEVKITGFGRSRVESKDGLKDAVVDLLRRSGIKARRAATAVSGRSVIVRYVNMVSMSDDDLRNALRFEADKYIPFEIGEVVLDCQKLEDDEREREKEKEKEKGAELGDEKEMKVLMVAVKRSSIDEHVSLIQSCGLVPAIIDVDSFALGNAFELRTLNSPRVEDEDKVVALVDIGATKTNINILRGKMSYFSREVYLAGNDFTECISRRLGLERIEAEALKVNPEGREDEIGESILPALDDLGNEIHLSFDYYENQFDREVDEVYVSGGSARLPGLETCFERIFDRRIQFWDPTENLDLRGDKINVEELKEHSCQMAISAGLAARILTL